MRAKHGERALSRLLDQEDEGAPRSAEIYNMGGGRECNYSMLEAIAICERIVGKPLQWTYDERARIGDHIWYISDLVEFKRHYPSWRLKHDLPRLVEDIYARNAGRWTKAVGAL